MDVIPCDWVNDSPGHHHQSAFIQWLREADSEIHGQTRKAATFREITEERWIKELGWVVGEKEGGEAAVRM